MMEGRRQYFPILFFFYLVFCSSQFAISQRLVNFISGVPTLWINRPSIGSTIDTDSLYYTPILLEGNASVRFIYGFSCNLDHTRCFLGISLVLYNSTGETIYIEGEQLVWSSNRDHPVQVNATLELGRDGNLVLADSDGTLVWSTNTTGKSVSGLNLTEMGNPLYERNPDLGCTELTPISCDSLQYHSLVELKNTDYFSLRLNDELNSSMFWLEGKKIEDCKRACLSNCSGKAAVYKLYPYVSLQGNCLLLNEVFSLIDSAAASYTTVFLKVQNSRNALVIFPRQKTPFKVIIGCTLIGIILILSVCSALSKKRSEKHKAGGFLDLEPILPGILTRFSYNGLKIITQDFSRMLGKRGFGSVYEGTLSNGTKIAVKHLDGVGQVKESFLTEVKTVGGIHHINLVKLIGYCAEKSHRLLIYEYMVNGSLDRWITQENGLTWNTRKRIISDIVKGLAYLHEDCSHKIIHLDIKPQNILLDQNFNAKISDFGLSKLIEKDKSKVVTRMRGTPGYIAPEWLSSIITEKVDVYAFGNSLWTKEFGLIPS